MHEALKEATENIGVDRREADGDARDIERSH